MEQKSDADYYKSVNQAYERIFAHPASNVIVLEAGKFDSLNPKDIATLSATIDAFQP
jgi:deoxyadenosine/deoxycytidine kinase